MKPHNKSLYSSNIVFVVDPAEFVMPENSKMNDLFTGVEATGARFADDPVIHSKFLHVPRLQLRIALEGNRLRVDDESRKKPDETSLIQNAVHVFNKLFPKSKVSAYGFNFDLFYQFQQIIPREEILSSFSSGALLKKAKIKDLGVQFTLEDKKGDIEETVFLKITAPAEIALHYNRHIKGSTLPKQEKLETLFRGAYDAADTIVEDFKF